MSIDPDDKIKELDGYAENGLYLDWELSFGKYKGTELRDVIRDDVEYVFWCIDELSWFKLNLVALKYLFVSDDTNKKRKDFREIRGGSCSGK